MKKYFLFLCLLPGAATAQAASSLADSLAPRKPLVNRRPWYRPRHLLAQTGGGIGMIALGAGYSFYKNRLDLDIVAGGVPEHYAGTTLSIAAAKLLYTPFRVPLGQRLQLHPLMVGGYFSYTHGTINDELPGQYSSDYYWYSTDTRIGPILGSRLTYLAAPIKATGQARKISAYYELGSNDLYLVSYFSFNNSDQGIGLGKVLTLALGVKVDI